MTSRQVQSDVFRLLNIAHDSTNTVIEESTRLNGAAPAGPCNAAVLCSLNNANLDRFKRLFVEANN